MTERKLKKNPELNCVTFKLIQRNTYPSRPNPGRREKNEAKFLFSHFFLVLKKFYEGLKSLHKTLWGTTKKCKNKNLAWFLFQYNFQKCTEQEKLIISKWWRKFKIMEPSNFFDFSLLKVSKVNRFESYGRPHYLTASCRGNEI